MSHEILGRISEELSFIRHGRPVCDVDCEHLGSFGGVDGCQQQEEVTGDPWPEPIQPGEKCLHPADRNICQHYFTVSMLGLCAALEGAPIVGGPHDNTELVKTLTRSSEDSG